MKNWQPLVFGPELCFAFFLARDGREGWKGGMVKGLLCHRNYSRLVMFYEKALVREAIGGIDT